MILIAVFVISYVLLWNVLVYSANLYSLASRKSKFSTFWSSNKIRGIHPRSRPASLFAWDLHDADDLWQSCMPRGAQWLLAFRTFALLAFAFVMAFQGLAPRSLATGLHTNFLPYFTNWTFMLFGLYTLLGVIISIRGLRLARYGTIEQWVSGQPGLPAARQFDALDKMFAATLTTVSSSSAFLSAFYWAVLYDGETVLLENAFKHGGTVVLLVLEYLLGRVPVASSWFLFAIWYTSSYAVFMWLHWALEHWWVYWVFDWRNAANIPYYLVQPLLGLAAFHLMYCVAGFREFLATGKCCCACCGVCGWCGPACVEDYPIARVDDEDIWQDDGNDYLAIELGVMPLQQPQAPTHEDTERQLDPERSGPQPTFLEPQ